MPYGESVRIVETVLRKHHDSHGREFIATAAIYFIDIGQRFVAQYGNVDGAGVIHVEIDAACFKRLIGDLRAAEIRVTGDA